MLFGGMFDFPARAMCHQSDCERRSALMAPCFFLSSTLRRLTDLLGLVGLRGVGGRAAARTSATSRASASSRLRSWLR